MRLDGRVALVTGGASGIGEAISEALAVEGAKVAIGDIAFDRAEAVADRLGRGNAKPVRLDVTDGSSVRSAVASAVDSLGPIQILVNCAGWDDIKPFVETDEELWRRLVELNLMGVFRVTHEILPSMIDRKAGVIVNIGSEAGRVGSSGEAVYSACKGGVMAFTKTIAREAARSGVRSNCVCPGPTDTPQLRGNIAGGHQGLIESMTRNIPLRRLGEAADVAGAVVFLASDEASFITGQTLSVSGGLSMC